VNEAGYREAYCVVGRRGGKSLVSALVAVFESCLVDHTDRLQPGEVGVVMVVASDRAQGRVILSYIEAFLTQTPILAKLVSAVLKESIELTNNVRIEIRTADNRSIRGYSVLCAVCDELAFWQDVNSATPAAEVLTALRPALLTTGGLILGISSPYSKAGPLHDSYSSYFGKPNADVLVWRGTTLEMNCTVNANVIRAAFARDPVAAETEYNAVFRSDSESFLTREVVEPCIVSGRFQLPHVATFNYSAFCDPSGGRGDSMTLGISHEENDVGVLDVLAEVPAPFDPQQVVKDFAAILKRFRIFEVVGDRFGGEWVTEAFQRNGVSYRNSELTRNQIYLETLPLLMSRRVQMLDNPRLKTQLLALERRVGRG
jgi:hypothetical protein